MSAAIEAAARIEALIPAMHGGSLCFYGEWFGGRRDNWHRVTEAEAEGDTLIVHLNEGETLTVTDPYGVTISKDAFRIERTARVHWAWFYYGRPRRPENLYEMEYLRDGDRVSVRDTTDWFEPKHLPDSKASAVQMG